MLKLPFRAKLFPGWLMRSWYLTDDSDDGSGENPDGGDDGGTGSETEPGPEEDPNGGDDGGDTGDDEGTAKVSTTSELSDAFSDDSITEIILESDVTADEPLSFYMTSGEKTLNLNGYSITATSSDSTSCAAIRVDGGTLTIEGSGSVNGGGGGYSNTTIWAAYDATVIINDGSYDVELDSGGDANACIYASNGAAIVINGGDFRNTGTESSDYTGFAGVLNIQNNSGSTITCYGGTYRNQNPADGDDRDTTTGATFLGDGCIVTESASSDGITVYTVTKE